MSAENFASLIGEHGPSDLVKKYRIGPPRSTNETEFETLLPKSSLHQPDVWPSAEVWGVEESASNFKSTIEVYFDRICYVADFILGAICDGIINNDSENANMAGSIQVLSESHTRRHKRCSLWRKVEEPHLDSYIAWVYQQGSRHKKGSKCDVGAIIFFTMEDVPHWNELQRHPTLSEKISSG